MWMCLGLIVIGIPAVLTQTSASTCSDGEWRCLDGSCIPLGKRCDGRIDCSDSSDERFSTCRLNRCDKDQFQCTYGGCVNATSTCDDKADCVDNSDELLPICRNDVDSNICRQYYSIDGYPTRKVVCQNSRETCDNGEELGYPGRCNGHVDCRDGSDETLATCADAVCEKPLFRCAYGGCAHRKAKCDDIKDCADGSDESDELCDRILPGATTTTTTPKPVCTLPPFPEHGNYSVGGVPDAVPGQIFENEIVFLNVSCDPGYGIVGDGGIFCFDGSWSAKLPRCARFCSLPKHPSVEYRCIINEDDSINATRECELLEPDGMIVEPKCIQPVYYYPSVMNFMHCVDGTWDHIVVCTPDCGKVTGVGDGLIIGGENTKTNELPWHVGIYRKKLRLHVCGGTIVSTNIIISAAHCFWNDRMKKLPASRFMVAAGTLHRTWRHPDDVNGQYSDVYEIKLPARFQGGATKFQDDIAVVILSTPLQYTVHVRPACLDFDYEFDSRQLQEGNVGKVAGWGLTAREAFSELLQVAELPYIQVNSCIALAPRDRKEYITGDKMCAGAKPGTALCQGDSGGGFAVAEVERGVPRYYLRGVASVSLDNRTACAAAAISSFTQLLKQEEFIKDYL